MNTVRLFNKIFPVLLLGLLPGTIFAIEQAPSDTIMTLTIEDEPVYFVTPSDIASFSTNITTLKYDPNYTSEIEKDILCLDIREPCLLTSSIRQSYTVHSQTIRDVNKDQIKIFVDDIARNINTDPTNAKLKFNDDTNSVEEITPHVKGIALNTEETIQKIDQLLRSDNISSRTDIELPHEVINATVTSTNSTELGIIELLGKGSSDFKGSTKSRIHNITTAAKRFDGLVIPPNEEFSFVSVLGPVDGEHGYKEELVIRDNETKPEYGGGICQVSTTVFRGAIFTGMKITQRRNHSYPVHYYSPTGFDATVYIPAPDFRFINNTPGHILLNMEMIGTELIFKYYGTDDDRKVEMDGPHVTDRQPNGAMKTYFTQTVTNNAGEVVIDDVFKSNYKSPDDYPHPGDVAKLTAKPDNWSKAQWKQYKTANGL